MRSRIFIGEVFHSRIEPVSHRFRYPVYCFALDLAELPLLDHSLALFGYNRLRPVSIYDRDYLGHGSGKLETKLREVLDEKGVQGVERMVLITSARYLGYAFNPVSFYYCYDADEHLRCVVAEVNNTFGERHLYVLDEQAEPVPGFQGHYRVPKSFYVSPFNDVEGEYDFRFADLDDRLDAQIRVVKAGKPVFHSWVRGRSLPLTGRNLLGTMIRFPLNPLMVVPRIHLEAGRLFFFKKLRVTIKPGPYHPDVVRAEPSWLQRIARRTIFALLGRLSRGCLVMHLPDRSTRIFGDSRSEERAVMTVNNWDFFLRIVLGGDVALGETYTRRDWDTPDITRVIRLFLQNREAVDDRRLWLSHLGRAVNRAGHALRRDHRSNVQAHYDLGNELFSRFLDPTMTYSCARFEHPQQSLEQAQRRKLADIVAKLELEPHHHLLEIGCGWGSLAVEAARTSGCRVTAVTLSRAQYEYANRKVREAGLAGRVTILLRDYREVEGTFDRIASVEMLEAVGEAGHEPFFRACEQLLAPGGMMLLQVITVPDRGYERYRKSCDWIQKVIFPGSLCPSLGALQGAISRASTLTITFMEDLGPHYARTLREWRKRFLAHWHELEPFGYDETFKRVWEYYLCYCEAGFEEEILGDVQMVLARAAEAPVPALSDKSA